MNLTASVPLTLFRTWALAFATLGVVLIILLPSSVLTYLHFQHSILPAGPLKIPLEFSFPYLGESGPYSYLDLTPFDKELSEMWDSLSTNRFTKLTHSIMFNLEYVNISDRAMIGNVRTTITKLPNNLPASNKSGWPFMQTCPNLGQQIGVLNFNSIVGKSINKSLLINSPNSIIKENVGGMLDFLFPKWVQNVFVPLGVINLFSFNTLDWILGRNNSQLFSPYANGVKLNLPYKPEITSIELAKVDSKTLINNLKGKYLLVEMDKFDLFVVRGSITFEWIFDGIRFWIYWWPGLCFLLGVGLLWFISSSWCVTISLFGYGYIEFKGLNSSQAMPSEKSKKAEVVLKNLNELNDRFY